MPNTLRISGHWPTSPLIAAPLAWRDLRYSSSVASRRLDSARDRRSSRSARSSGLRTKSLAPCFIASTASSIVPRALVITTIVVGSSMRTWMSTSCPSRRADRYRRARRRRGRRGTARGHRPSCEPSGPRGRAARAP